MDITFVVTLLCACLLASSSAYQYGEPSGETPLPPPMCACPRIYRPLCASDANTYNNDCLLECKNRMLETLFLGLVCGAMAAPFTGGDHWAQWRCICTSEYEPVCATDGQQYYNICIFRCRQEFLNQQRRQQILSVKCTKNFNSGVGFNFKQ